MVKLPFFYFVHFTSIVQLNPTWHYINRGYASLDSHHITYHLWKEGYHLKQYYEDTRNVFRHIATNSRFIHISTVSTSIMAFVGWAKCFNTMNTRLRSMAAD